MAVKNGRIGTGLSAANGNVEIAQASTDAKFATYTVTIKNPSSDTESDPVSFRLYFSMTATPGEEDLIDDGQLASGDKYETTCRALSPDERVILWANTAGLVCRVEGLEEEISKYA